MVEGPALTRSTMVKLRTQGKIQTGFEEEKIGPQQTSESQGGILLPRNTDSQKAMEKLEGQRGPSSHSHLEFTFRRPNEMVGRTDVRPQEPQGLRHSVAHAHFLRSYWEVSTPTQGGTERRRGRQGHGGLTRGSTVVPGPAV